MATPSAKLRDKSWTAAFNNSLYVATDTEGAEL